MNRFTLAASALALAALTTGAQAGVVYSEDFTNGFSSSNWSTGDDAYWKSCTGTGAQGNCVVGSGGQSGAYFNLGTATGPEPDHRFFISQQVAVNQDASYTLSFYLRDNYYQDRGLPYTVPVQAKINGTAVGSLVTALNSGWNLISLTWESGTATTAEVSLWNEYQLSSYWQNTANTGKNWGFGNDFALDTVSLACSTDCGTPATGNDVPEPGSLALVGAALAGLGLARRRRA